MRIDDVFDLFTIRFELWPFHLDLNQDYPLAQVISRMIHVAGEHAGSNGFGIKDLNKSGYTWVLYRLSVEMDQPIKVGRPIDISTGVLNRDGMVTRRLFVISQGGQVVATGLSHWVAIDLSSRRPTPISNVITRDVCVRDIPPVNIPEVPRKLVEGMETFVPSFDHQVRYSDLDMNKHVNTAVWVSLAMDCIGLEQFERSYVHRADLHFVNEAFWGDTLTVEHCATAEGDKMRVKGSDGKECFVLSLKWNDK